MEDKRQPSYYAIIPAFVRYDDRLLASEKIFYGEITALANKFGYCFAANRYFAKLYKVSNRSITNWIAKLEKYDYIKTELLRDDNLEVIERKIYIIDDTYRNSFLYPLDKNVYTL